MMKKKAETINDTLLHEFEQGISIAVKSIDACANESLKVIKT
jgi:hypothetical protein